MPLLSPAQVPPKQAIDEAIQSLTHRIHESILVLQDPLDGRLILIEHRATTALQHLCRHLTQTVQFAKCFLKGHLRNAKLTLVDIGRQFGLHRLLPFRHHPFDQPRDLLHKREKEHTDSDVENRMCIGNLAWQYRGCRAHQSRKGCHKGHKEQDAKDIDQNLRNGRAPGSPGKPERSDKAGHARPYIRPKQNRNRRGQRHSVTDPHRHHQSCDRRTTLHNRRSDRTRQHARQDVFPHQRQPRRHDRRLRHDFQGVGHQIHPQKEHTKTQEDFAIIPPAVLGDEFDHHKPQRDKEEAEIAQLKRHNLGRERRANLLSHHHTHRLLQRHQVGIDQADHRHHQQAAALNQCRRYSAKDRPFNRLIGHPIQPHLNLIAC